MKIIKLITAPIRLRKLLVQHSRSIQRHDVEFSRLYKDLDSTKQRLDTLYPHRDYPREITIETATICNAHCDFCAYHGLGRRGNVMPMALIAKIINEIATFAYIRPIELGLNGVNEPLADNRMPAILNLISARLPQVKIHFVTNGSLLSAAMIDQLAQCNLSKINISVNFHDKESYERRMGLSWQKIIATMDILHKQLETGEFCHPVIISRIGDESQYDTEFTEWIRSNYPHFHPFLKPFYPLRNDTWIEATKNNDGREGSICLQWQVIHVASTGEIQFCCMDAKNERAWGSIRDSGLLDIYNQPQWYTLRHNGTTREAVSPCNKCVYWPGRWRIQTA